MRFCWLSQQSNEHLFCSSRIFNYVLVFTKQIGAFRRKQNATIENAECRAFCASFRGLQIPPAVTVRYCLSTALNFECRQRTPPIDISVALGQNENLWLSTDIYSSLAKEPFLTDSPPSSEPSHDTINRSITSSHICLRVILAQSVYSTFLGFISLYFLFISPWWHDRCLQC